jgi:hypothetical protein
MGSEELTSLQSSVLPVSFCAGGLFVFAGKIFVVAFSDLLLDFLGYKIHRCIKIALNVRRKQVRTRESQADGAGELPFGGLGLIMLEGHARIHGKAVELCQFVKAADDVIFDGLGQGEIMRRKDQFHGDSMQCGCEKIQRNHLAEQFRGAEQLTILIVEIGLGRLTMGFVPMAARWSGA